MNLTDPFKSAIESYLSHAGMKPTAFGCATVKDPKFVFDLRGDRSPSVRLMDQAKTWKADHPPASTEAVR